MFQTDRRTDRQSAFL